ncbi:MAG: RNA 2',3'-cyclic phosphodiesterase [Candidatus Marinimicrobia bacterium]|nr:RNA 2',3'-cyclic phosphodiesterase [Candidatus Neomarinimicrobiota bacterium]
MKKINEKRVFIGVPISTVIKPLLAVLKSKFTGNSEKINWIPSENIHLTLRFVGNLSIKNIEGIIQSLEAEIIQNKFEMVIESTGAFPSSDSPRVLWLGIKRGAIELISLHTQIESSLLKITDKTPAKTFTPHITIAKIPQNIVKIDVLPFLNTVYSPIELDVNSICLFESQLLQEGVKYRILNEFPLN